MPGTLGNSAVRIRSGLESSSLKNLAYALSHLRYFYFMSISLLDLPRDLLLTIYQELDLKTICTSGAACKNLYAISQMALKILAKKEAPGLTVKDFLRIKKKEINYPFHKIEKMDDLLAYAGLLAFKANPNHFLYPQLLESPYQKGTCYGFGIDANPNRDLSLFKILCLVKSTHASSEKQMYFPLFNQNILPFLSISVRKPSKEEVAYIKQAIEENTGKFELQDFWKEPINQFLQAEKKSAKNKFKSGLQSLFNLFSRKKHP